MSGKRLGTSGSPRSKLSSARLQLTFFTLSFRSTSAGKPMSSADALRWGLVNRVVPQADVLDTALALAADVAKGAPLAVQASKTVARGIIDGNIPAEDLPWELTDKALARLTTSADTLEGVMAFMQKREPVWKGE